VKLLLDTHVMLWWLRDNPKLGSRTRQAISDSRANLLVSIASLWELSIKARLGKIDELGSLLHDEARAAGLEVLAVAAAHLAELERLPRIPGHGDPFDHLILAQAKAEKALLVTADRVLDAYGIPTLRF
jgi:PIN domain nuclease of toxin-antitoxin system